METEKLPCKECGKLVLPSTLDRTGGKCMPCYKKDHPLMKERKSFLYEYGGYLVYLVFLIGLFLNGAVAYMHYGAGKWFFGTWALLSIVFLPRPALALILLAGHKSFLIANMPAILRTIFSRTQQRYRGDSFMYYERKQVFKSVVSELAWLVVWLIPAIEYVAPVYGAK